MTIADPTPVPAEPAAEQAISPAARPGRLIPMIVAFAFLMENLDSTIITTSIPEIARSLGEGPVQLNLAITSYLLSLAIFMPISGWMADRFGTRTVFCCAIAIFTLGSALSGLSTSLAMMVGTRMLQGFGGAMMTPVGRLILLRTFPRDGLVTAMMYMSIPALIGPSLGPVVGGFITTYASWRWIFYVNIPIGLVGILLARRYFAELREPVRTRFDFAGFAISGLGLALLQLAIENLARPIGPPLVEVGLWIGGAAALLVYFWHARRHENPALDISVFAVRTFRIGVLSGSVCRMGLNAGPFLLPLMFQLGFGLNPLQSGLLTFLSSVGALFMRAFAKSLLKFFGFRRLLVGNAFLAALAIAGFALMRADTPHWIVLAYVFGMGFLRSTQFIGINTLSYADLPLNLLSRGTSVGGVAQQLSMSFGVAIAATLLTVVVGPGNAITTADFHKVFLLVALLTLLSITGFARLTPRDGLAVSGFRPPAEPQKI